MEKKVKLIKTKKELKRILNYESYRYFGRKYRISDLIFRINEKKELFYFNYLLRKSEYFLNTNKKILCKYYKFKLNRHSLKYSIFLPINTIDEGFKMVHIGPIMINAKYIGKNFVVHRSAEIVAGGNNDFKPIILDNVLVFVNSTITGNVILGNNTIVAANALVNKSFECGNVLIGGVPSKILKENISF